MLPTHRNEPSPSEFKFFCFTPRHLSPRSEFLICCSLVFLFYLIYGYFAELIFTYEGISGWFITLVQFFYYTIFGLYDNARRQFRSSVPIKIYLLLAFLTLGTMVRFLNPNLFIVTLTLIYFNTGSVKFLSRTSQLSHSNYL